MPVNLAPALSIVIKRSSIERAQLEIVSIGDVASSDEHLVVVGPFFETETPSAKLDSAGLEYFEDYFDIPNSGGPVPDWCKITLSIRIAE